MICTCKWARDVHVRLADKGRVVGETGLNFNVKGFSILRSIF